MLDYGCPAFANAATTSIDMNAAVTAMAINTPSIGSSHQCTSLSISKRPLFYFLFRSPGGRNKQGKEKVSPRGARPSDPKNRWIVETFGDGLRHTLLAPPDYYAKQQREAEQRLAGPRFSRPRSHKPQVTAGGLRPPRFTSHSALCFSFRLELRLHVTAVLATGRLPYL